MWAWEGVACPVCHQPVGQKCRTLKTKRVTDTHTPRVDVYHEMWRRQRD
jgi:hypothetical protein